LGEDHIVRYLQNHPRKQAYLAEFIHDNLMIQANASDAASKNGVKNLLYPGSSCINRKLAP